MPAKGVKATKKRSRDDKVKTSPSKKRKTEKVEKETFLEDSDAENEDSDLNAQGSGDEKENASDSGTSEPAEDAAADEDVDEDAEEATPKGDGSKLSGKVKWFSSKGYGFIVPDSGESDVFVHQSAIHAKGFRSLAEGEPVEFDTEVNEKGKTTAINVTGPNGAFVKGTPKPEGDSRGGGGRGRGGGRGGGRGRGRGGGRRGNYKN